MYKNIQQLMVYRCDICNETFLNLYRYERHINKKTTCDIIKKQEQKMEDITCKYCKKTFSSKIRLKGHVNCCKEKQNQMSLMIELLVEKIDIQNDKIDKLMNKESKTININNVNNVVNQQQNIFNIVPFGEEKLDYITDKEYIKIFKQGCRSMQMFIPMIYCNDQKPENMNVYISNFNDDSIKVFNGKNWIIEKKEDILHNMYYSKRDHLEYKFEDMYDDLTDNAKYFFEKFKACNDDKEVVKTIQYDMKNILYSNRDNVTKKPIKNIIKNKPIKTKKKFINVTEEKFDDREYVPNKSMFF